ncbi:MAG: alpha/beta hydrolase [Candidatus Dormibacteria bacterium]
MTARSDAPFDPDVVAPWRIGEGRRGALLLHGFAGTPPELRRLGDRLAGAGWRCHGPLLAGHGTTPEDLARTRWQDWAASAEAALAELRAECDQVVVAGQSTGGSIALHLAANDPGIAAVACLATPVWLSGWRPRMLPVAKHVVRWDRPGGDVDLYRLEGIEELWSYGRRSTRSIHELVRLLVRLRSELVSVRAPVLICHGERDRVIAPANAVEIEHRLLCSMAVERHMLPRSGHGISVDVDRDEVNRRVMAWFDRFTSADAPVAAGVAQPSGLAASPSSI